MPQPSEPVVLEAAPLPREQIGPFLLLGLDKDADKEQIEANWARCVTGPARTRPRVALEDINWRREVVNDADRRIRADAASFNPDTTDGRCGAWRARFGRRRRRGRRPGWRPRDAEEAAGR